MTPTSVKVGTAPDSRGFAPIIRADAVTTLKTVLRYLLVPYRAARKWANDRCTTYAAALAYYSAFSLAPVLVIAVSVAGLIFGHEAANGRIVGELESLIGSDGAKLIERMISASYASGEGILATLIGTAAMLLGATGLFMQLGHAFEAIFGRRSRGRSAWMAQLVGRLRGLTVVIGVGFLLMISLVASAAILAFSQYATRGVEALLWLASLLQVGITLFLQSSMIAIIYRVLVPTPLNRRALIVGAVTTAVLFEFGKWALGVYLGRSSVASTYGAAGSLALILIWVYYVSLIMLYGAELTFQLNRIARVTARPPRPMPPPPPVVAEPIDPAAPALLQVLPGMPLPADADETPARPGSRTGGWLRTLLRR